MQKIDKVIVVIYVTVDFVEIGKEIKRLRIIRGLTQEALADAAGISRNHIGNIESGYTKLGIEALVSICSVLAITPNDLIIRGCNSLDENFSKNIALKLSLCSPDDYDIIMAIIDDFTRRGNN